MRADEAEPGDSGDSGDPGTPGEDPFEQLLREAAEAEDLVTDGRAIGVFALARESVREAVERARASESHADRLRRAESHAADRERRREMRAAERERIAAERAAARSRRLQRLTIGALCTIGVAGLGIVGLGAAHLATDGGGADGAAAEETSGGAAASESPQWDEPAAGSGTEEPDRERKTGSDAEMLQVDPVWASEVARESGVPERALHAYAGAALTLSEERPECGLGWNTLAAIGFVETAHGTIHGSEIGGDGRVVPRIQGVPLDGTEFAAIPDTDGGRLDGEAASSMRAT